MRHMNIKRAALSSVRCEFLPAGVALSFTSLFHVTYTFKLHFLLFFIPKADLIYSNKNVHICY